MRRYVTATIVPFVLIVLWELVAHYQILPPAQTASPSQILIRLGQLLNDGLIIRLSIFSLGRLISAVTIGTVSGILLGISVALKVNLEQFLGKTLQFFAGLPVVVWLPFGVMVFGIDEAFKVALTAISTFFLIYSYTFQATKAISKEYLELAFIFEKNFKQTVREIIIPALLPAVFTGLRVSLGLAWVVLFFVEYASSAHGREGLGWFIADARAVGRIEDEFAGLLVLGLLAFFIDSVVNLIQRYLTRWNNTVAHMKERWS